MLEHLLGTPPKPPPPDVDIPEPDSRGDLSIKEMYKKHRTIETCRDCHKRIDPLGFALENFNAVGEWRDQYDGGRDVDSTGTMPDGTAFEDGADLRQLLLSDTTLFRRNLTTQLLTYASGRTMGVGDRPQIDAIAERAEKGGLRDLVINVVQSEIFLTK
jgi:hypothetical protein